MIAPETNLSGEESFRLREYLAVLRFRKWSILIITVLVVLAALYYTKQKTPTYSSTIQVIATDPLQAITNPTGKGPAFSVESSIVTSLPVKKCAAQILANPADNKLGADLSKICSSDALTKVVPRSTLTDGLKVEQPTTTSGGTGGASTQSELVLSITDSETSPQQAQRVAQAFALAYQQYKTSQATQQLDSLAAPLKSQLNGINKDLSSVDGQITKSLTAIAQATDQTTIAGNTAQLASYEQQRQQLEQESSQLNSELLDLSPSKLNAPEVTAPATLPSKPSSPNKLVNTGLGLILGLAVGIGLAFLREKLDDRLRGREDLEERAAAPVLAIIPKIPRWWHKRDSRLIVVDEPTAPAAESFRTLRTNVAFLAARQNASVIMVTSGVAGEGKTHTACNLSVSLAAGGKRVILLSADLRNPRVHEFFHVTNEVGLSNVLSGETAPWDVLLQPEGMDNLRILASGPAASHPGEMLQSDQMAKLIEGMRPIADFVIVDTAPVLLVADALSLVPLVDGVILVADAPKATRGAVEHAREQLDQVGATVLGAVLNRLDRKRARYYGKYHYGYYYYYGSYGRYYNGFAGKREAPVASGSIPSLATPRSEQ